MQLVRRETRALLPRLSAAQTGLTGYVLPMKANGINQQGWVRWVVAASSPRDEHRCRQCTTHRILRILRDLGDSQALEDSPIRVKTVLPLF